jgi:hypothetical protein
MMHTDSEHEAIDMMKAMKIVSGETKRVDKATRRETRYEKWKRSKKTKSEWTIWSCCFKKQPEETKNIDTSPLII